MKQGTEEWFAARCGKITASRIGDIMAMTKSGPAASRKNYIAELICQRLTGNIEETYKSPAMQWGTENEPFARAAYEAVKGVLVAEIGFVDHPEILNSGASPDGLVETNGSIEIKCPNTATHIDTMKTGKIDQKYLFQMVWVMECTGREWCDFVSYDPRLPEELSLYIKRVYLADFDIQKIREEVVKVDKEIEYEIQSLREIAIINKKEKTNGRKSLL